jgi:RNA polymerase sigma-70 factor (ECF subfamily)
VTAEVADSTDLQAARRGDRTAFAGLVRRHQQRVYGIALRLLHRPAEADEVAQESFLRLYSHLESIESDEHLKAWLIRVTTNLAVDRLRARPPGPHCALEDVEVAAPVAGHDPLLTRRLRALLATLPHAAQSVVILRYQQDLDPTDIAELLAMPLNTVKSHLKRSLDHLRERLSRPAAQPSVLEIARER